MGLTGSILTGVISVHSYSVLGSKKEPWTKRWPFPCSTGYWALKLNGFFKRLSGKTDSSVVQFSCVWFLATLWTAARRASVSITNSRSLLRLMSVKSEMPSNHLILCHPLLLLHSIFPSNRVFSNESALHIRWPKYWSFSFNISSSNEHSGLISFRMDWLDLLAVQGTLKSLL